MKSTLFTRPANFFLVLVLFPLVVFSQRINDRAPEIKVPVSSELFRYASYPVSNFTGVPDIQVPLYELNFSDFDLPISLSYHGSGHKVDDIASWVGLGWSLQAGGVITRIVNGAPDEELSAGIFRNPIKTSADVAQLSDEQAQIYFEDVLRRKIDTEPDAFYYNFLGMSGKFFLDPEDGVQTQPKSDFLIEFNNGLFKITDDYGRQFFFHEVGTTRTSGDFPPPYYAASTSWHLTKIISADKKDTIEFSYIKEMAEAIKTVDYSMEVGRLAQIIQDIAPTGNREDAGIANVPTYSVYYAEMWNSFLSRITFSGGYIEFLSTRDRSDHGMRRLHTINVAKGGEVIKHIDFETGYFFSDQGYNLHSSPKDRYRLKLSKVNIYGTSFADGPQRYSFEYDEQYKLPPRLNCGVDWWGYSNGKIHNETLVPLPENGQSYEYTDPEHRLKAVTVPGILRQLADRNPNVNHMKAYQLKRIVYPTGGYADFEFEPNRRSRSKQVPKQVTLAYAIGMKENNSPSVVEFVAPMGANRATFQMSLQPWTDQTQPYIELWNLTTNRRLSRDFVYPGEQTFVTTTISLKPGDRYRVIANINKNERDPNDDPDRRVIANIYYMSSEMQTLTEYGPGLRIRSISSYSDRNVLASREEYRYGKDESGFAEPRFFDYIFDLKTYVQKYYFVYWAIGDKPGGQGGGSTLVVLGRPIFDHYSEGNLVSYPFVTRYVHGSNGESHKTVYEYSFQKDEQYEYGIPESASLVSNFWRNGKLLKKTVYKQHADGRYEIVREKINRYVEKTFGEYHGLRVRRNHIAKGVTWFQKDASFYFTWFDYYFKSGIRKLISSQERTYVNGLESTNVITDYDYLNDGNLIPRVTTTVSSSDRYQTIYTTYPKDYLRGTPWLDKMASGNMLRYPVERIHYVGGGTSDPTVISGKLERYDDAGRGLVNQSYILDLNRALPMSQFKISNSRSSGLPDLANIDSYDPDDSYRLTSSVNSRDVHGNPNEIRVLSGTTVLIWSYSGQYPIAKIENASYDEVKQGLNDPSGTFLSQLSGKTEPSAADFTRLNNLRGHSGMLKAQITTYTYKPLVGMTSMTDPRGVTEYYQYDGFQRLKDVLDFDKNVLQNYRYHYRP
ncbi:hypothetical protein [Sphingobacterium haloxyli]|uniref:Sugar-binding protein n=1 Tax=Sphingobacterium haloxyli TaxID=2100533 RepID=A0A2S9IWW4_9SPHI|nr:hypothetical protein [Sphingobacterium haloxyli]PRD44980.1 hypothetical protein C5745_18945 [Sphingobacterium haloxyli]